MSGLVPYVIIGSRAEASTTISRSYLAPASRRELLPLRQGFFPFLALRGSAHEFARYSKVVSSGAINPARAPASIVILQIVIRSSIERERMAEPVYSMTDPVPPLVADLAQ